MRHVKQLVTSPRLPWATLAACALLAVGCNAQVAGPNAGGSGNAPGTGNTPGIGGNNGTAGNGLPSAGSGGAVANCAGPTDPRLVVASQRLVRLTLVDVINSVRVLIDATEATALQTQFMIGNEGERTFPPLNSPREGVSIIADRWASLDRLARAIGEYVFTNFATVTRCTTATDACATTYLTTLAERAYRRPLDAGEQTRLTALYTSLKSATVNNIPITSTVQQATQYVVYAIFSTPQFLYRSELGSSTAVSTAPPGVYLTPHEVATQLSFFLTGAPPDAPLLADAGAGRLAPTPANSATILGHVNRLLGTQAAKDNLTTAMFTYYKLNLLGNVVIDPMKYPAFSGALLNDMRTESRMFLNNTLWSGTLADLLTSRTTFLNSTLASVLYKVPVPAGATATNFVQTTLPASGENARTGIVTQAGFITSRARPDVGSVVARGLVIKETMLCVPTPPPPDNLTTAISAAKAMLPNQTAKQQIAYRAASQVCTGCHGHFDSYGLVLENYDAIGGYRTMDEQGRPVETDAKLPDELGGGQVANAIDFAQTLSTNAGFVNCMAKSVLQYALSDVTSAPVDLGGCAVQDLAQKFNASPTKDFTELVRQVAMSNAVALRTRAP